MVIIVNDYDKKAFQAAAEKAASEYLRRIKNPPPAATGEGASDISKKTYRKDTPIL